MQLQGRAVLALCWGEDCTLLKLLQSVGFIYQRSCRSRLGQKRPICKINHLQEFNFYLLWKWLSVPFDPLPFLFCGDRLLLIRAWQQQWDGGAEAGILGAADNRGGHADNEPATGLDHFLHFLNREKENNLNVFVSTFQHCINELLSSSVKCNWQIQQPNSKPATENQRESDGKEKDRERERKKSEWGRMFAQRAIISTKMSLEFTDGHNVDQGTAGEGGGAGHLNMLWIHFYSFIFGSTVWSKLRAPAMFILDSCMSLCFYHIQKDKPEPVLF